MAQRPSTLSSARVLQEVELLVLGRGPEVLPLVSDLLLLHVALRAHDGDEYIAREIGPHLAARLIDHPS